MDQEFAWDNLYRKNKNAWKKETPLPSGLKGLNVLELGVGNGKTLKSILKQKPSKVTAIDISTESISICNSLFSSAKNLSLLKANVTSLPFKDNSFDGVICYYVLNNLTREEREKAVSEIFRILKKSGFVLFEDFAVSDLREKSISKLEDHTLVKENSIICHFFSLPEIKSLFSAFSNSEFKFKSTRPFRNNLSATRNLIHGRATK